MRLSTLSGIHELQTVQLAEDVFYFWFPYGLGDLYIVTLLKDEIDKVLGGKSVFVVQDKHGLIPDLCGVDYISVAGDCRGIIRPHCDFSAEPARGRISGGHPSCRDPAFANYLKSLDGVSWYKKYFGIPRGYSIDKSRYIRGIPCADETRRKVRDACGAEVEEVVFFIPDAFSTSFKCVEHMNRLISGRYSEDPVICNSVKNTQLRRPAVGVDLSLYEVLQVCFNCKEVVSNRNGICDVIHTIGGRLTVFYDGMTYRSWAISKMFGDVGLNEIVL